MASIADEWATCHGTHGEGIYYVNRRTGVATYTNPYVSTTVESNENSDDEFDNDENDDNSGDSSNEYSDENEEEEDDYFEEEEEDLHYAKSNGGEGADVNAFDPLPDKMRVREIEHALLRGVKTKNKVLASRILVKAVESATELTHHYQLLDFPMSFLRALKAGAGVLKSMGPEALNPVDTLESPRALRKKKRARIKRLSMVVRSRLVRKEAAKAAAAGDGEGEDGENKTTTASRFKKLQKVKKVALQRRRRESAMAFQTRGHLRGVSAPAIPPPSLQASEPILSATRRASLKSSERRRSLRRKSYNARLVALELGSGTTSNMSRTRGISAPPSPQPSALLGKKKPSFRRLKTSENGREYYQNLDQPKETTWTVPVDADVVQAPLPSANLGKKKPSFRRLKTSENGREYYQNLDQPKETTWTVPVDADVVQAPLPSSSATRRASLKAARRSLKVNVKSGTTTTTTSTSKMGRGNERRRSSRRSSLTQDHLLSLLESIDQVQGM